MINGILGMWEFDPVRPEKLQSEKTTYRALNCWAALSHVIPELLFFECSLRYNIRHCEAMVAAARFFVSHRRLSSSCAARTGD